MLPQDNKKNSDDKASALPPEDSSVSKKSLHLTSKIEDLTLRMQLSFFSNEKLEEIMASYDFITRPHAENVAALARVVKEILGLNEIEARLLELLGLLHDIGKSINYDYISILLTPRKLEYDDENLHKLMVEHAFQSENKLDELGYKVPVKLLIAIRNHHRFLVQKGDKKDLLLADPDYKQLTPEKKEMVINLLDIFMILDFLCAYTEASRPSNWFDNIVFDREKIIKTIDKRYGDVFKLDVDSIVREILNDLKAVNILEKNTHHAPEIIASTMKEWAEKESIYGVNYLDILLGQIIAMKEDTDLTGFKKFLTTLTSPVFGVILWEKWAEEVFSEIIEKSLKNSFIGAEIRLHLQNIVKEHPQSLFGQTIKSHLL